MAKILTPDEVLKLPKRKLKTIPVVLEQRVPFGEWNGGTILKWVGSDFALEFYQDILRYDRRRGEWYEYGKTARIWDTMPTKEELQGAAWD